MVCVLWLDRRRVSLLLWEYFFHLFCTRLCRATQMTKSSLMISKYNKIYSTMCFYRWSFSNMVILCAGRSSLETWDRLYCMVSEEPWFASLFPQRCYMVLLNWSCWTCMTKTNRHSDRLTDPWGCLKCLLFALFFHHRMLLLRYRKLISRINRSYIRLYTVKAYWAMLSPSYFLIRCKPFCQRKRQTFMYAHLWISLVASFI